MKCLNMQRKEWEAAEEILEDVLDNGLEKLFDWGRWPLNILVGLIVILPIFLARKLLRDNGEGEDA